MELLLPILLAVLAAMVLSAVSVYAVCRLLARKTSAATLKKKTDESGRRGEEQLLQDVRRFTRSRRSKILTNVYVTTPKGRSTEIDLVLIDYNGIFVFESKNYNGRVYGDESQREWLHVLRNGDRFTFYNPIWQNRGHISAIRKLCGDLDPVYFKNIIVFGRNCQFSRMRVTDRNTRIVRAGEAKRAFRQLSRGTVRALSYRDMLDFYEKLLPYTRSTKRQRRLHVKDVKKKH